MARLRYSKLVFISSDYLIEIIKGIKNVIVHEIIEERALIKSDLSWREYAKYVPMTYKVKDHY